MTYPRYYIEAYLIVLLPRWRVHLPIHCSPPPPTTMVHLDGHIGKEKVGILKKEAGY